MRDRRAEGVMLKPVAPPDAGFPRRRFLAGGVGGMAFVAFGATRAFGMRGFGVHRDPAPHAAQGIRVDFHSRVFNGQDIDLARFLSVSVARSFPEYAGLMNAGGDVAQALAWTLAPSGALEAWRLHGLAGGGVRSSFRPATTRRSLATARRAIERFARRSGSCCRGPSSSSCMSIV
jgi:hypothetical protein